MVDKLLSLFRNEQSIVVIEIGKNGARVTPVKANLHEQQLFIQKSHTVSSEDNLSDALQSVVSGRRFSVVLSLEPEISSLIYSTIKLHRENPELPIDEVELENIVAEAIWKFFEGFRGGVAKKIGAFEADVVLSEAKIWNFELDGKKVIHPVGHLGSEVVVHLSEAFVNRAWHEAISAIVPEDAILGIGERPAFLARLIFDMSKKTPCLVAGISKKETCLTFVEADCISYYDSFAWGEEQLLGELSKRLSVTPEIVRYLSMVYNEQCASPMFVDRVGKLFENEYQILFNGLQNALSKLNATVVYLSASHKLPEFVFNARLKNKSNRVVKILPANSEIISQSFGFEVKLENEKERLASQNILNAILNAYLVPKNSLVNAFAKRRVRWLEGR